MEKNYPMIFSFISSSCKGQEHVKWWCQNMYNFCYILALQMTCVVSGIDTIPPEPYSTIIGIIVIDTKITASL